MAFRLTCEIVDAKAATVNTLLGTPERSHVGHVYVQGAYGGYSVRRMTTGGGETGIGNAGYGTLREAAQVLDGMIEGIRLVREIDQASLEACICHAPHPSCECPVHPTCQGEHL